MAEIRGGRTLSPPQSNVAVQPVQKKPKPDYKDTYNILIGSYGTKKTEEFILHKTIIDTKCPGFLEECLCRGNSDDRLKDKLGVDVETFQAFVHGLYTSEVDTRLLADAKDGKGKTKRTWPAMLDLWLYADAVWAYKLCDKLTDLMLDKFDPPSTFKGFSDPEGFTTAFNTIFESNWYGDPDSMIYKLFIDLFFAAITLAWQPLNIELISKVALREVAASAMYGNPESKTLNDKEKRVRFRGRYLICGEEVRTQASDSLEA